MSEYKSSHKDTISCDVCILGGGSSGIYAAIRLKDQGKSVIVVERNDSIGGHSATKYFADGSYLDYGVLASTNNKTTTDYFQRLGVEWKPFDPPINTEVCVDFKTGKKVSPNPIHPADLKTSLLEYRKAIEKFAYLYDDEFYNLPDKVPEELLRPFSEFVENYDFHEALDYMYHLSRYGGDFGQLILLYVLKFFGIPQVDMFIEGLITPANGVLDIYHKAAKILGSDVHCQNTAVSVTRSDSGVSLVIENRNDGTQRPIKAKKLLITFPPILENLKNFDLDKYEISVFEKWIYNNFYTAVVANPGVPDHTTLVNVDPSQFKGYPSAPSQWKVEYKGVSGYLCTDVLSDKEFTENDAKDLILSDLKRMSESGVIPAGTSEIVGFANVSPPVVTVSANEVRDGFYRKLYALQGQRSTFYTGHSFCSNNMSIIWKYTDNIIEQMFDRED